MSALVYPLETAPDDVALVGGKAAALGRLLRAGLSVPPGFAVSAAAFHRFLETNGLDAATGARLAQLRDACWPDDLRASLTDAYTRLAARTGGAPLAVRSSATAEDSADASFAGQHETLLNVNGLDAVLEAIVDCWMSLYSEAAEHYRRARGVAEEPAMGVVVQTLVPAEASGVAFTLDPVTGDRDVVVIDAAWGLGEGIVAGAVTPDHFAVRKRDGALVRRQIADKELRVVPSARAGTRSEELTPERAREPALSDEQAVELARLAAQIEELAGAPQDIEWALAGGRFAILQSRPVTAAGASEGWVSEFDTVPHPDTLWTSANVQEVLPDQLSPFSCDMNLRIMDQFGEEPVRRVGIKLRTTKDPFFAFFYGRPFLNLSMMIEIADQSPFGAPAAVMEQFLGQPRDPDAKPQRPSLAKLFHYAIVAPRMAWASLRMPADIRRAERIVRDFEEELAAPPLSQRSDRELVRMQEEGLERGGHVGVTHVSGGGMTSSAFEWLHRCTERWLGDEQGELQARLCTGLSGVESAQPAYELWDLSRLVLRSGALRRAFESRDGTEIARRLDAQENEDAAAFRRRLAEFLARHGHRSVMEAETAARSWDEDLPTVFAMLRNYLQAGPETDPRRIEERQRAERESATKEALGRLRWWQRVVFRGVLRQAQRWVVMREHTKSLLVRATHRGRRITRELARRLVDRGLLDGAQDFYYLTWDEAKAALSGASSREQTRATVGRRKREEALNRAVLLPETFRGRPAPLRPDALPLPEGDVLHGIPVSPGRVTGRARVILDPRRDATIEPGEILVAPVTDAGWTPLFVAAAGVVVDTGGPLSHGSTVAREYGLPAVVNVRHATRVIRTGQTITVDGAKGVVVLG